MSAPTRRRRCTALLAGAAFVTGFALAAPPAAADPFAGLIPGKKVSDSELARLHGKGSSGPSSSSSSGSTSGGGVEFVGSKISFSRAFAKGASRSARGFGPDFSGKQAARVSLGELDFPRFNLESEIELNFEMGESQ